MKRALGRYIAAGLAATVLAAAPAYAHYQQKLSLQDFSLSMQTELVSKTLYTPAPTQRPTVSPTPTPTPTTTVSPTPTPNPSAEPSAGPTLSPAPQPLPEGCLRAEIPEGETLVLQQSSTISFILKWAESTPDSCKYIVHIEQPDPAKTGNTRTYIVQDDLAKSGFDYSESTENDKTQAQLKIADQTVLPQAGSYRLVYMVQYQGKEAARLEVPFYVSYRQNVLSLQS